MNLNDIISMHGYGMYVWPAYFITLFIFGINLFSTLTEKQQTKKRIKQYLLNHNE